MVGHALACGTRRGVCVRGNTKRIPLGGARSNGSAIPSVSLVHLANSDVSDHTAGALGSWVLGSRRS